LVGHDYTYAIPSFLDTALHYHLNGLSIQWFTPTFGGGLPAFPNPNNMQFSLPAFLSTVLPPWPAMMIFAVIYVTAGFLTCYYFFNHTLRLNWTASILGAIFFSANGFVITRIATGQIGYFAFTLLAAFLIILFEKKLSVKIATPLFGILAATYIHMAGYFVIIIFALSIIIVIPLLFLYKPDLFQRNRLALIIAAGSVIGITISMSKLVAVFSFMRFFPRLIEDNYSTSFPIGLIGVILQILGTQVLVPLFILAGMAPSSYPNFTRAATGSHYGMWELDVSMTPVVFVIILICLIKLFHNPKKYINLLTTNNKKIALLFFVLFLYITVEFTLAKGFIYPTLRQLPILSSLRGNVRYTGTFIFPLAFFSAATYNHWSKTWGKEKIFRTYLLVNLLAVLPLGSYFLFDKDMFWMFYNITTPQQVYEELRASKSFEITKIGKPEEKNTGALLYRTSNLNLYEPVFGFELENFHPQVTNGSIWNISNGYYNMTDPTSYIYPELNNNKPFDRFHVEDKRRLELFVKHLQPDWKVPVYQRALDWLSGLTFLLAVCYIIIQWIIIKFNKVSA
jgi:hypothetical protein